MKKKEKNDKQSGGKLNALKAFFFPCSRISRVVSDEARRMLDPV